MSAESFNRKVNRAPVGALATFMRQAPPVEPGKLGTAVEYAQATIDTVHGGPATQRPDRQVISLSPDESSNRAGIVFKDGGRLVVTGAFAWEILRRLRLESNPPPKAA